MTTYDAADDFFVSLTASDPSPEPAEPGIRVYIGSQPVLKPEPEPEPEHNVRVLPCCSPDNTDQQNDDDGDDGGVPSLLYADDQHASHPQGSTLTRAPASPCSEAPINSTVGQPVLLMPGDPLPSMNVPQLSAQLAECKDFVLPSLCGTVLTEYKLLPMLPPLTAPTLDDDSHYASPPSASYSVHDSVESEEPDTAALQYQAVLRHQIKMKRTTDRRRRCVKYGNGTDPVDEAKMREAGAKSAQKRLTTLHAKGEEFRTCGPPGVLNSFIVVTYSEITGELRISSSDDLESLVPQLRVNVFTLTEPKRRHSLGN